MSQLAQVLAALVGGAIILSGCRSPTRSPGDGVGSPRGDGGFGARSGSIAAPADRQERPAPGSRSLAPACRPEAFSFDCLERAAGIEARREWGLAFDHVELIFVAVRWQGGVPQEQEAAEQLAELVGGQVARVERLANRQSPAEIRKRAREFLIEGQKLLERLRGVTKPSFPDRERAVGIRLDGPRLGLYADELESGRCHSFIVIIRLDKPSRAARDAAIRTLEADPRVNLAFPYFHEGKLAPRRTGPRPRAAAPPSPRIASGPRHACNEFSFTSRCIIQHDVVRYNRRRGLVSPTRDKLMVFLRYQGSYAKTLAAALFVVMRSGGALLEPPRVANLEAEQRKLELARKKLLDRLGGKTPTDPEAYSLRENTLYQEKLQRFRRELLAGQCPAGVVGIRLDVKSERERDAVMARLARERSVYEVVIHSEGGVIPLMDR